MVSVSGDLLSLASAYKHSGTDPRTSVTQSHPDHSKEGQIVAEEFQSPPKLPELEKHLFDVSKGRGYLSKDVARDLGKIKTSSASALAEFDPAAFQAYNAYQTAFSYSSSARFVYGVEQAISTLSKLV